MRHELQAEAFQIMEKGGFHGVRVEHKGPWWLVRGELVNGNEHVGTTHLQADPQDPRDLARRLVEMAKPAPVAALEFVEEPEAAETEEPTFTPEDDPLSVREEVSEAEREAIAETEALFTHSEPEYEAGHESGALESAVQPEAEQSSPEENEGGGGELGSSEEVARLQELGAPDPIDADFDEPILSDAQARQLYRGNVPDDPELDEYLGLGDEADYRRDPLLTDESEPEPSAEPEGGAQFIFGDNLGERRTAAIGLVWLHADSLMPAWDPEDDDRLKQLRNFTAGVAAGTFTDDPDMRDELDTLEARLRFMGRVTATRDAKVKFIKGATHEQLEAFDVEADWP